MTEEEEVIQNLSPEAVEKYCDERLIVGTERTLIEEFVLWLLFGVDSHVFEKIRKELDGG